MRPTTNRSWWVRRSIEFDPLVAPEDAAMSIRDRAPGAVDHEDDYVERDEGPDQP